MPEEPTLSEVMWRLNSVVTSLASLADQMREDRKHAADTFVRRDVFDEARKADKAGVADVAKDIETLEGDRLRNANFRKQVGLGAALAVLSFMGAFGLAIFNLVTGGAA